MIYPERMTPYDAAILIYEQCYHKEDTPLKKSCHITSYPHECSIILAAICEAIDNNVLPWENGPEGIEVEGFLLSGAESSCKNIVVSKADLKKWFEDFHPELKPAFLFGADDPQNPLPLNPSERKTVAKLIFTMAVDCYGYDPTQKKSPIPKEITEAAANADIAITEDTVRKWLKEGASLRTPH